MHVEYLAGLILDVVSDAGAISIRLDLDESESANQWASPVLTLILQNCPQYQNAFDLLGQHLYEWVEVWFQEEGGQKHLSIIFDYPLDIEIRLDYSECKISETSYTVDDLSRKLKSLKERHANEINSCWMTVSKYGKIIQKLRQEIFKELDRFERKCNFFANTEKAERFEIGRKCYQRILDLLDRLENTDIT
jgi:hypothetical protein